jgi:predicted TIM-barrel fold metal-dependent hydrolase
MNDQDVTQDSARPASQTTRQRNRVDVHSHFIPGFYREALIAAGNDKPDGMPRIPDWNAEDHLALMDSLGVNTAMLSISSPGVHFGDDQQARTLSRRVNEEGQRLSQAYPGRFGFFASVPLPDVEGAVAEAVHALDQLQADGIILETNHHGLYLGDPRLEPLYAELNKRKCVIFVHPTSPFCSCCQRMDNHYPRPMMEFMFETTRSISDMVLAGVLERYPDLRVIVPHAGAALPVLAERIDMFGQLTSRDAGVPSMRTAMGKLYFDLAGAPVPLLLGALMQIADPARVLFGSDYPFTPASLCETLLQQIESTPVLEDASRNRIFSDNAHALFPALKAGATAE